MRKTRPYHHTATILRRQRCSDIESLCTSTLNGHVSRPDCITNITGSTYARTMIRNPMSNRPQRCIKLVNANRASFICSLERTRFGSESVGPCNSVLYFEGAKGIPNTRYRSDLCENMQLTQVPSDYRNVFRIFKVNQFHA